MIKEIKNFFACLGRVCLLILYGIVRVAGGCLEALAHLD